MLGRKSYTETELNVAQTMRERHLQAFEAVLNATNDEAAVEGLEPVFFNTAILALDRLFVHRLRSVTGKDGNPINEVEMLTDSLLNNGSVLRPINVIRYVPAESVLGLQIGDRIALRAHDYDNMSKAFLADLHARYVESE